MARTIGENLGNKVLHAQHAARVHRRLPSPSFLRRNEPVDSTARRFIRGSLRPPGLRFWKGIGVKHAEDHEAILLVVISHRRVGLPQEEQE